jgi:hypothetical protein
LLSSLTVRRSVDSDPRSYSERAHFGWTIQDVFERYGAPTEIMPEPGYLELSYRLSDDPANPSTLRFRCVEGLITFVYHGRWAARCGAR